MKKTILLVLLFSLLKIHAQDTLGTGFLNNNSASGVSFEVEATSSINLIGILNEWKTSTSTVDIWLRWGGVNGIAGDRVVVNAANGWFKYQDNATVGTFVNGVAALTDFDTLHIPAGAKLGIVLAGSTWYHGKGSGPINPDTFTGNYVILRSGGPTTGFGGSIPNMKNDPRGFLGSIIYELDVAGNCAAPLTQVLTDSITASSAKITWTAGAGNNSYFIEYGPTGFTPGNGTTITGTYPAAQTSVKLTNLTPGTNYQYYIGEICNSGSDSVYSVTPYAFSTAQLCANPTNLSISNITGSSAEVDWNYTGSATNFTIYYGVSNAAPGSADSVVVTTAPHTLSNLFGNSDYDVYVRANCNVVSAKSDTVGPATFTTACGPTMTPYLEDFNNTNPGGSSNPSEPDCWTFYETNGANGFGFTIGGSTYYSGFARGGTGNGFRFYTNTHLADGDSMALISPQIAGMASIAKQVSFWVRSYSSSSSYDVKFVVGTVADPTQLNSFQPIDTISIGNNTTYQNFIVPFTVGNGYNGNHEYIAFMDMSDEKDSYVFDDIEFSDAPVCLPSSLPVFSNVTPTSAMMSWTTGGGTSQQIEYGPVGFTQGTGTIHRNLNGSFSFTNLAGSTCYDVYLRDTCASAVSPWVGPFSFCTLCNYYNAPLFENFALTTPGTNQTPSTPDCWNFGRTNGSGNGFGYTRKELLEAYSDSVFFYLDGGNNYQNNDLMGLISPGINNLTTGNKQVSFFARSKQAYATHNVRLIVGTVSSPNQMGTFAPIDTIQIGNNTSYQQFIVEITTQNGYNGTHDYIAILDYSVSTSSISTVAYLDDISIQEIPSCGVATNISYSAAQINWVAGQGQTYSIEYGATGFSQGTGVMVNGLTSPSYNFSGLFSNTCYDVYILDSCTTGASPWVGPFTFCTSCTPVSQPFTENFEGASVGSSSNPTYPICWNYVTGKNTQGYGYVSTSANPNGNRHYRMYSQTTNTQDTIALISPAIAGLTNSNSKISFYAKSAGLSNTSEIIVGTTPSPFSVANASILDTIVTDVSSYATKFEIPINSLTSYNGTDEYVFLMHGNASTYTILYFDDITIEQIPPCIKPSSLNATNISATGADLSWASANGTGFRLEFGPSGFTPGTGGNGTVLSNATSPTTVNSLTPNTSYDFYVADNCDSLNFEGPFAFTTNCTGGLNGTYTVGAPTSDFKSLDSAIFILKNCGITGNVTFNLQGGFHHTDILLGSIAGASDTSQVIFAGSGVGSDTLNAPFSNAVSIELDGTSYVTFKNFTVMSQGTSRSVWMHNNSHHITFENIHFLGTQVTQSTHNIIVGSSSATSILSGSGNNVNHLTIKDCKIDGGYHGIVIMGTGANNKLVDFHFEDNTFVNNYFYGIRMHNVEKVNLIGNSLAPTGASSTAIYLGTIDEFDIVGNEANGGNYALYMSQAETSGNASTRSSIINNMLIGGKYGVRFATLKNTDIYHNSIYGQDRGMYMSGNFNKTFEFINNIVATNMGEAIYTTHVPTLCSFDYNLYYSNAANAFAFGSNNYATLGAWQTAVSADNDSSLFGDPQFMSASNLRISLGTLANDKGDNSVNVAEDIDGNLRPAMGATRVDIGAFEYTPLTSDFALVGATLESGYCLSTNDTVKFIVENVSGYLANLSTDSIKVNWSVSGPINSSGKIVADTGSLALGDSIFMYGYNVDMSTPGMYTLNAHIEPSGYNSFLNNDTANAYSINIYQNWWVSPASDTIQAIADSATLTAYSPWTTNNNFFITEISHYNGSTNGAPVGGKPNYLGADDYIEITGVPGADLGGITLEQWTLSGIASTYTFPTGTYLSANGTAIIGVGDLSGSTPSPSDFYYHGTGGHLVSFSSGEDVGRILKNAHGQIIDAVAYGELFKFPAAAGVATADWTGKPIDSPSSWGLRLEGPDKNSPEGWVQSTQDPNTVNSGVTVPSAPTISGFSWSELINGSLVQISTNTEIKIGASSPGIFKYVASLSTPCGLLSDTVLIYSFVAGCPAPSAVSTNALCEEVTLTWNSDAGTTESYIEYGPKGFSYGNGIPLTNATSPQIINGLTTNTAYDFYLVDSCSTGGFSTPIMVSDSTTYITATAQYSWTLGTVSMTNAFVNFNANASTNAVSYTWDFGDGSAAVNGVSALHPYLANGTYWATVTVAGPCDTAIYGDSILVEGISIEETLLSQSLNIFPNPNSGTFVIEFDVEKVQDVSINIYSPVGQKVYQHKLGDWHGHFEQQIDLPNSAAGIYLIQIQTENAVITKQVSIRN